MRTHLSALVNHTIVAPEVPCDAYKGFTTDVWQTFLQDCKVRLLRRPTSSLASVACPTHGHCLLITPLNLHRLTRSRSCCDSSTLAAWNPRCVKRSGLSSWDITSLGCHKLRGTRFVVFETIALPQASFTWNTHSCFVTSGGWTRQAALWPDHARVAQLWGDCSPAGEGATRCSSSQVLLWGEHGQFQSEDGASWLHHQQWGKGCNIQKRLCLQLLNYIRSLWNCLRSMTKRATQIFPLLKSSSGSL